MAVGTLSKQSTNSHAKTSRQPVKVGGAFPLMKVGMGLSVRLVDLRGVAQEWSTKIAKRQRNVGRISVAAITRQINNGLWELNGDTIVWSTANEIIDGGHRITATNNAAKPIAQPLMTLVVFGVEPTAFDTIDSGRSRTAGDALKASGHVNCLTLAATAKLVYRYRQGTTLSLGGLRLSALEIDKMVAKDPAIVDAVQATVNVWKFCRTSSVPAFCYYVFRKVNASDCACFFDSLATGADLNKDHPLLALRQRLVIRDEHERWNPLVLSSWFFRTWNAVRTKSPVSFGPRNADEATLPKPF